MRVVFLGATKGMGRALARLLAARGDELFLLGRDRGELERSCRELEILGAPRARFAYCDLLDRATFAPAIEEAASALGCLDAVIVTAGMFAPQEQLEADAELRDRLLTANFTNTVHFCELARARLLAAGGGTLCVFSSVAGERGRKPVALYGASKAGLSRYLEALDHKFRSQGLRVIAVKPGFVRTGMTAALSPPPFAGEPESVARVVLRAIERGTPEVYAPPIWRWIMAVIRALPRAVLRRIEF